MLWRVEIKYNDDENDGEARLLRTDLGCRPCTCSSEALDVSVEVPSIPIPARPASSLSALLGEVGPVARGRYQPTFPSVDSGGTQAS